MTREAILKSTIEKLNKLPENKLIEVADFTTYLVENWEMKSLTAGIEQLASDSEAFSFLDEETVEYGLNDLKERY
jgi:hypothetical protein